MDRSAVVRVAVSDRRNRIIRKLASVMSWDEPTTGTHAVLVLPTGISYRSQMPLRPGEGDIVPAPSARSIDRSSVPSLRKLGLQPERVRVAW